MQLFRWIGVLAWGLLLAFETTAQDQPHPGYEESLPVPQWVAATERAEDGFIDLQWQLNSAAHHYTRIHLRHGQVDEVSVTEDDHYRLQTHVPGNYRITLQACRRDRTHGDVCGQTSERRRVRVPESVRALADAAAADQAPPDTTPVTPPGAAPDGGGPEALAPGQ